jgi:uncharacterized RDD family membrane protein YckC
MRGFFLDNEFLSSDVAHVNREQLQITGLTGVEVTLDIAGPGSRSYAFVIDWHIRLLFALAWFVVGMLVASTLGLAVPSLRSVPREVTNIAIIPALCIYFFYHPVLEVLMRGRTPGKRMAGVRIVTRNGGTPATGALIIRNLFRLIDSLPTLYLVGLVTCILSAQRVRVGDMAAGTLLVLDDARAAKSLEQLGTLVTQSGLPLQIVELVVDVLHRWQFLDLQKRDALARSILAQVEPDLTPAVLERLHDTELQRRLRTLLSPRTAV